MEAGNHRAAARRLPNSATLSSGEPADISFFVWRPRCCPSPSDATTKEAVMPKPYAILAAALIANGRSLSTVHAYRTTRASGGLHRSMETRIGSSTRTASASSTSSRTSQWSRWRSGRW